MQSISTQDAAYRRLIPSSFSQYEEQLEKGLSDSQLEKGHEKAEEYLASCLDEWNLEEHLQEIEFVNEMVSAAFLGLNYGEGIHKALKMFKERYDPMKGVPQLDERSKFVLLGFFERIDGMSLTLKNTFFCKLLRLVFKSNLHDSFKVEVGKVYFPEGDA